MLDDEISDAQTIAPAFTPITILNSDLLFNIFILAVHSSSHPGSTALDISQVCRYWRIRALDCHSLWGFIEIKFPNLMRLFLKRSGQTTPLSLSWTDGKQKSSLFEKRHIRRTPYDLNLKHFRLMSIYIIPRLCSLTLHINQHQLGQIRDVFCPDPQSDAKPLQIRYLDLRLHPLILRYTDVEWISKLPIDPSYLRELTLRGLTLPWSVPPNDKLTHFALLYPPKPPTIKRMITFLSHCPCLNEFSLGVPDFAPPSLFQFTILRPTNAEPKFSNIKTLSLSLTSGSGYKFIRQLLDHIPAAGAVSSFNLAYRVYKPVDDLPRLISSGALSYFTNHNHMRILYRPKFQFNLYSAQGLRELALSPGNDDHGQHFTFDISCALHQLPHDKFNWTLIHRIMEFMPKITRLDLIYSAYEVFTLWPRDLDIRAVFPHLTTLGLSKPYKNSASDLLDYTDVLNSLHPGLEFQLLIVDQIRTTSHEAFVDAICRRGVEAFKAEHYDRSYYDEIVCALRRARVTVIYERIPKYERMTKN